jgi:hypothetical protein
MTYVCIGKGFPRSVDSPSSFTITLGAANIADD